MAAESNRHLIRSVDDVTSFIHPTQSEALGEAHLALAGKPLHVHG